jgi:hypothetical protein
MMRFAIRKPPKLRSKVIFAALERIEHDGPKTRDVPIVARHERQASRPFGVRK